MRNRYHNDLKELARLSEDIEQFCQAHGVDVESAQALQLCLDEVATNVISYAWPDGGTHTFEVALQKQYNVIIATVCDDGQPFDPTQAVSAPVLDASLEDRAIGGLGVHFCRTLMQRFVYTREKNLNVLTLERALK